MPKPNDNSYYLHIPANDPSRRISGRARRMTVGHGAGGRMRREPVPCKRRQNGAGRGRSLAVKRKKKPLGTEEKKKIQLVGFSKHQPGAPARRSSSLGPSPSSDPTLPNPIQSIPSDSLSNLHEQRLGSTSRLLLDYTSTPLTEKRRREREQNGIVLLSMPMTPSLD